MKDKLNLEQLDPGEEVDVPSNPGPGVLGRTPLVGSVRRSQNLPVIRDEVRDEFGQKGKSLLNW